MNVVVLVKSVVDPSGQPRLGPDFLMERSGEGTLDPGDEFAVEAALQLTTDGGTVTAISMGPEGAAPALRRALAMGANGAVLVCDPALRGADTLVTARVLAAAARQAGFDLVLAGVESADGYTGTLPMAIAELLDVPSATFARKVEVREGIVRIERQTETGYEVVECELPAVATVTAGATEPRYPTLKGIMASRSKPLEQRTAADLGLDAAAITPTQRVQAATPEPAKSGGVVIEAGEDTAARIADALADAGVI
ncbi:MAG: electron transfer flavoprotein subunit beta/FixA family protein [Actinomycetota bacterium]